MTVVAIRNGVIAADCLLVDHGLMRRVSKIATFRHNGACELIAGTGMSAEVEAMAFWYVEGAEIDKFPKLPDDSCTELIVVSAGQVKVYDASPHPVKFEGEYHAFGSGSDVASGAMYAGADAMQAVQAAIDHRCDCGMGITAYRISNLEKIR